MDSKIKMHQNFQEFSPQNANRNLKNVWFSPGEGLPEKFGRSVQPTSQNLYPIYDQDLRFSLPYL